MPRRIEEEVEALEGEEPEVKRGRPPKIRMMECTVKCLYKDALILPGTVLPVEGEIPVNFKAID